MLGEESASARAREAGAPRAQMGFAGLARAWAGHGGGKPPGDAWRTGSGRGDASADLAVARGGGWRRGQRQVAEKERAGAEIEEGEG